MKKSNIILLSLLVIILIIIVVIQLKIKSTITIIEGTDLEFDQFEKLDIQNGWTIELHNDTLTKVTINNDSIKHMISQDGNTLILKENTKDNRNVITISNPRTEEINITGNSTVRYYTKTTIDSLLLSLSENSDIIIYSEKEPEGKSGENKKNTIGYLKFNGSGKSGLNIYTHVNTLEGVIKDTSSLYIRGKVTIKNLNKSSESRINSW